jgi:hypothetical protein
MTTSLPPLIDVHSPYGSWLIGPVEDLLSGLCPVLPQISPQPAHLHAIDSDGNSVGFHGLQGLEHVTSLEHSFDEVWLFGTGLFLASRKV